MSVPEISVIMPVYNGESFVEKAISSILNQSYTNFELIIINDGSTDSSEQIILSFKDTRIVYLKNEVNLKLIKSLNKGIVFAKGRYIARMDADDISLPDRFEKQIEVFKTYTGIGIVNIQSYLLSEDGSLYRKLGSAITINFEAIKNTIVFQNMIVHPGVMVDAELMKRYKYKDDESVEHIEDFDLWNRMLADGHICFTINEHLLYYRDNNQSINHIHRKLQLERMYYLVDNLLHRNHGFKIDENVLMFILGKLDIGSYKYLDKANDFLQSYCLKIKTGGVMSEDGYKDMVFWKRNLIFVSAIRALSFVGILNKVGIFFFLLSKLGWMRDKKWRNRLKEMAIVFRHSFI
ncbi:glycosyltransferase family 2 protein [Dysgonomonas sp. ZJ709]|uniref:glycosyltransferase family 2 protein n=1 Tax=Dysgonomonas sp. ZJ709 TaxID=2709797 RepID=UPI0013E9FC65|nr:glycosyltransferase family 2 protein [Dysgonomonas sp. ZJ709]